MLEFNVSGLLIPPSVIKSTLKEFEENFIGDSPENVRNVLYNRYINYKDNLKSVCGKPELRQWIDGSYVKD